MQPVNIQASQPAASVSAFTIQNALKQAKELNIDLHLSDQDKRAEAVKTLKDLYIVAIQNPESKEQLELLSLVLTKYGRMRYEAPSYSRCMVLSYASLNAELVSLGLYDKLYFNLDKNLEDLEHQLEDYSKFFAFNQFLISSDPHTLAEKMSVSPERGLHQGFTILWLASGLYNTPNYDPRLNKENIPQFESLVKLGDAVYSKVGTTEGKAGLAEIYYMGYSRLALIKDEDLEKSHTILEICNDLNPTTEMQARVLNLKSGDFERAEKFDIQKKLLLNSLAKWNSLPKERQNPILVALVNSNLSRVYLRENNLEEAKKCSKLAVDYVNICPPHAHLFFAGFDQQRSLVLTMENTKESLTEALKHIDRALETFKFFKQSKPDAQFQKMLIEQKLAQFP